jgi:ornithine--oxo-acid transaminase
MGEVMKEELSKIKSPLICD